MNRSWDSIQYSKTSDFQANVAKELLSDLAIQPDENVLDFGCGIGNLTIKIAQMAYNGSVLGVDTSPSMIEQAKFKEICKDCRGRAKELNQKFTDINLVLEFLSDLPPQQTSKTN